jgi:adenylate cyclase
MPKPNAAVTALTREAEIRAERTVAIVRIGVGTMLALVFALSVLPAVLSTGSGPVPQIAMALVTIGGYVALGLLSRRLARPARWRPAFAWIFGTADVLLFLGNVASTVVNTGMPTNLIPLAPALWLLPIVLASGTLRYDPWLQTWLGVLAVGGLAAIGSFAFRFDPLPLDALDLAFLYHLPPNVIRLAMASAFATILVVAAWRSRALLARALEEGRRRAEVTRFLPGPVAERLAAVGLDALLAGRRQPVVVMFADIRGFTTLAEGMAPEAVGAALADFRARVVDVAERHGGVIDKFIGDGAMIVFGVPDPRPDDAARALACAIDLLDAVAALSARRIAEGRTGLRIGIGAHAGEAWCGAIGDERRLEFTVVGDTVNTAARLESLGKDAGFALLASADLTRTAGLPADAPGWTDLPSITLRGRAHPIDVRAYGPAGT